ncbi:MAG: ROK family protein [Nevskia sp.]|nr:ROK family protein [Nevskia sp.]
MTSTKRKPATASSRGPRTLAMDIGGTGLKASVLDSRGRMAVKGVRIATPYPCRPPTLIRALEMLVAPLPAFDRISIGFPGVVRDGRVITAPHFGTEDWQGYALEQAVARRFGKPARLLNDAEVQGLGIIAGRGLEVVLTLGTGVGSAVFSDGRLTPHLELAHHPLHNGKTYNEYIGNEARLSISARKWNRRVLKTIGVVSTLLNYDLLYLGGGNAANIAFDLPEKVRLASNETGLTGGIRLWDEDVWHVARPARRKR